VHIKLVKDLCGDVVVVAQKGKEKMFGTDYVGFIKLGFEIGNLQDFLGLLGERDIADGESAARSTNRILDGFFQFVEIDAEITKDLYCNAFALPYDSEEKMLGANIVMPKSQRLLAA
jgi:hypothetical protein